MNYRALSLIFWCLFISGTLWTATHRQREAPGLSANDIARSLAGPKETLSETAAPLRHYTIIGSSGNIEGYIFFTEDLAPEVQGYGGRIPMAVRIDRAGQIKDIRILTNNESLAYTGNLDTFVRQFVGKRPTDPLELRKDVDAISGATISSEAITRTLKKSLTAFAGKILATPTAASAAPTGLPWDKLFFSGLVFALCLAAILTANATHRWAAMAAGFVYFGILNATMLSIVQVANIGLLHIPDFAANPLWWLTIGFAFFAALVIGRAHCSSVCPFALVQETLFKLMRRRLKVSKIDPGLHQRTRFLKYWFLFVILSATFTLGNASAANIEPFVTIFRGHGTKLAWIFLILMLILSIFHFRFWCVYFCPVGAWTSLAARLSIFKIKPAAGCTHCKACVGLCPVQAISYDGPPGMPAPSAGLKQPPAVGQINVDESECILCGRCINGCPEGKLALRTRYEKT